MKALKYINKCLNIHENYTRALKLTPESDCSQNLNAVGVYFNRYIRRFHLGTSERLVLRSKLIDNVYFRLTSFYHIDYYTIVNLKWATLACHWTIRNIQVFDCHLYQSSNIPYILILSFAFYISWTLCW